MIAAIVLAAGLSRRMNGPNKLLHPFGDKPLVQWAVDAACSAGLGPVFVITGHEAERVGAVLPVNSVTVVHNPDFASGMASSLVAGINALPPDAEGVLIVLGDMPSLRAEHLRAVAARFESDKILVPVHHGMRGHPVLFGRALFADLRRLSGDTGAKSVIRIHTSDVIEVEIDDPAILFDVDTLEDFRP